MPRVTETPMPYMYASIGRTLSVTGPESRGYFTPGECNPVGSGTASLADTEGALAAGKVRSVELSTTGDTGTATGAVTSDEVNDTGGSGTEVSVHGSSVVMKPTLSTTIFHPG